MTKPLLKENSHLLVFEKEMQLICEPLFNKTKISFFSYAQFFPDDTVVVLSTYSTWSKASIENETIISYNKLKIIINSQNEKIKNPLFHGSKQEYFYLLSEENPKAYKLGHKFNVESSLIMIGALPNSKIIECFVFGSRTGKNIIDFYFSNWDTLKSFNPYIREKCKPIIDLCRKDRIIIDAINTKSNIYSIKDISEDFILEKYTIDLENNKTTHISKKELECIYYLSKGKSAKDIARIMKISPKTAERHKENIKKRFNIFSISQIIDLLSGHGLL